MSDLLSISGNLKRLQEARRLQREAARLEHESRALAAQASLLRRKHADAIAASGDWQPMDTAPADGSVIDILHEDLGVLKAEWVTAAFSPHWRTDPDHRARLNGSSGFTDVWNEELKFVGWRLPSNP